MSSKMTGQNLTRSFEINNPEDIKIACVVSEWHHEITENLLTGAKKKLLSFGLLEKNIHEINVPGSFELIFGTKTLINKDYDAIISIGCIIKGETQHFDFISDAVINGIKDLNILSDIPIILCVTTDNNIQQSIDRSGGKYGNKGEDSAEAALKMILVNSNKIKNFPLEDYINNLFVEAAKLVVFHQKGSASLLRSKLKIEFDKACMLINKLESAGIVGPFEGGKPEKEWSKPRRVLVSDSDDLNSLLDGFLNKNNN